MKKKNRKKRRNVIRDVSSASSKLNPRMARTGTIGPYYDTPSNEYLVRTSSPPQRVSQIWKDIGS